MDDISSSISEVIGIMLIASSSLVDFVDFSCEKVIEYNLLEFGMLGSKEYILSYGKLLALNLYQFGKYLIKEQIKHIRSQS